MKRVLVFGTFDLLHPGHVFILKFAATFGQVYISLSPDRMVKFYKKREPSFSYHKRYLRLSRFKPTYKIVVSDKRPLTYNILDKVRPDVIILGHDQLLLRPNIIQALKEKKLNCRIILAPKYHRDIYASSLLAIT